MKIALILASSICHSPYIYHYIRMLDIKKIDYDIVIWNKDNIPEDNCISYNEFSDLKKSRLYRVKSYFRYTKFVKDTIDNNDYKRVIVFSIFLGVLLHPYLKKKFNKSYFFDIRDYSPILNFFPILIQPIISYSFATVISSPGFIKWLPKNMDYLISHNYYFNAEIRTKLNRSLGFIILTIGQIRDFNVNKLVIDSFANNSDFLIKFTGEGLAYLPLKEYVNNNRINNVVFTGKYQKKDEMKYLENVSLVNILLVNNVNSKTLMTNRLYLAISNNIPVLVNSNTTQGDFVKKYSLGLAIENTRNLRETVLDYLNNYNHDDFLKGCERFLAEIEKDQKKFETNFNLFLDI